MKEPHCAIGQRRFAACACTLSALRNLTPMDDSGLPSDVLIVEDNFIIGLDTEMILRDLGVISVRLAGDAAAALRAIEARLPDFALIDVELGSSSGYDVAADLARRGAPFAFTTGFAELLALPPQLAGTTVIGKPYTAETLRELLQRVRK